MSGKAILTLNIIADIMLSLSQNTAGNSNAIIGIENITTYPALILNLMPTTLNSSTSVGALLTIIAQIHMNTVSGAALIC